MSQITNGRVTFGRNVKTAEYEGKKAEVEISFAVGEGEDYKDVLDLAATTARDKAYEILGLLKPPATATSTAAVQAAAAPQTEAPKTPARRGPKKPPVQEVVLTEADKAEIAAKLEAASKLTPGISTGEQRRDPNNPDDVDDLENLGNETGTQSSGDEENLDDLLGGAPAPVTDEDLVSAITTKNAKLKNPVAIRQLIGKFVKPGGQAREIAAENRQDFLDQLAAL